ncbi:MAG: Hsp20/alpha crystallin family protein [Acidobacteria bacterium]|nr:Hsp20/alpha crystallin family protein [Acidobacteriota bacterium]MBI3425850.1 Hsp20/alpha crystallin family protein [Acidobacteriota bacterium]
MSWIVKHSPLSDLRTLQQDYNRAFNAAFPGFFNHLGTKFEDSLLSGKWVPQVDIFEDQNGIALEADLPGVKPEDFKLSIENYKLTLSGERKFEHEDKQGNWQRVERGYGNFSRTFSLPNTVNVEEVKAEFKNGVLRITLPKREEIKARQIQVEVKGNGASASVAQAA